MEDNFEKTNATRWEADSEISTSPSRAHPLKLNPQATPFVAPVGINPTSQSRSVLPTFRPARRTGNALVGPRNPVQTANQRRRLSPEKKTTFWAEPPALLTTQRQRENEAKEWERKIKQVYLQPLEENADPYGVKGYYIWESKETTPMDLLGWNLEELNTIRVTYKVWIDWQEDARCLRVSSRSELSHERNVLTAIKAIREAIGHVKARSISCSPVYIAAVPTSSGMKSIVRATIIKKDRITGLQLDGVALSNDERDVWKKDRIKMVQNTREQFEASLVENLLSLSPYKGWMRLRLHFGHVEFSKVHRRLKEGESSFTEFSAMLKNPRTTGRFQRQLENATIADNVRKRILAWPHRFCPVEGMIDNLEDVKFKDTQIVFITTSSGNKLRLEADIDRIKDSKTGEYQIGPRRLFHDSERNKKMEILMIDVESRVDWTMEVISDNSIEVWPSTLTELINNSVTVKSPVREDVLGLSYPGVSPGSRCPHDVHISRVVVRSVIYYLVRESGYMVEISIFRTWEGGDTSVEPKMASSVSMYHPSWDLTTESIERTTKTRGWDKTLSHFFESDDGVGGLQTLMDEVGTIQELLSAAQSHERGKGKTTLD